MLLEVHKHIIEELASYTISSKLPHFEIRLFFYNESDNIFN